MKTLISKVGVILLVLIAVGNVNAQGSDFSWLNGSWTSRTGVLAMEIKVVNSNELAGSATFDYGGGVAQGTLQGKIIGDKIHITVSWPQRGTTSSYELSKQEDGALLGVITEGQDFGRKVRMTKS